MNRRSPPSPWGVEEQTLPAPPASFSRGALVESLLASTSEEGEREGPTSRGVVPFWCQLLRKYERQGGHREQPTMSKCPGEPLVYRLQDPGCPHQNSDNSRTEPRKLLRTGGFQGAISLPVKWF